MTLRSRITLGSAAPATTMLSLVLLLLFASTASAFGSFDQTFGSRGIAVAGFGSDSSGAYGATLVPGGGVLVVGSATRPGRDFSAAAMKLTRSGAVDARFGTRGRSLLALGGPDADEAVAVVRQRDGKFVVAATADRRLGSRIVVYRLTAGGRLDRSFGSKGLVELSGFSGAGLVGRSEQARAILLRSAGRIAVVGSVYSDISTDTGGIQHPERIGIAGLTASGRLDRTFGRHGLLVTGVPGKPVTSARAAALSSDGSLVIAGQTENADQTGRTGIVVARVTPSGALDRSFGDAGFAAILAGGTDTTAYARGVAVQRDGRPIVVGAQGTVVRTKWLTARLTKRGALDRSFGGGVVLASLPSENGATAGANAVTLDRGRIVVAGGVGLQGGVVGAVGRYSKTGRPDTAFGGSAFVVRSTRLGPINAVLVQASPRRYVTAGQAFQAPRTKGGGAAVAKLRP